MNMKEHEQAMAVVQDDTLIYQQSGQDERLPVGTPDWYAWLHTARTSPLVRSGPSRRAKPSTVQAGRREDPHCVLSRVPRVHLPHARRSQAVSVGTLAAGGEPRICQDGRLQGRDRLVALLPGPVALPDGRCGPGRGASDDT